MLTTALSHVFPPLHRNLYTSVRIGDQAFKEPVLKTKADVDSMYKETMTNSPKLRK